VPVRSSSVRVLIVEDFADARQLYLELLEYYGFEVHSAADGVTGLSMAKSLLPDAILLDLALPGIDGFALLTAVRNHPATAETPVLIVTAHAEPEVHARAKACGATAILLKPGLPEDLVRELRGVLPKTT
jgi:two-component system, cell cycle response regulator DivK